MSQPPAATLSRQPGGSRRGSPPSPLIVAAAAAAAAVAATVLWTGAVAVATAAPPVASPACFAYHWKDLGRFDSRSVSYIWRGEMEAGPPIVTLLKARDKHRRPGRNIEGDRETANSIKYAAPSLPTPYSMLPLSVDGIR